MHKAGLRSKCAIEQVARVGLPKTQQNTSNACAAEHSAQAATLLRSTIAHVHGATPTFAALCPANSQCRVVHAFRFFLLIKKRSVAWGPMVSDTPAKNISCETHNVPSQVS